MACIVAKELQLGANPVIAAFLHDVVEDTPFCIDDIQKRFGKDVAFLVGTLTKKEISFDPIHKQEIDCKYMFKDNCMEDIIILLKEEACKSPNYQEWNSILARRACAIC